MKVKIRRTVTPKIASVRQTFPKSLHTSEDIKNNAGNEQLFFTSLLTAFICFTYAPASDCLGATDTEYRKSFNGGWKFHLDDADGGEATSFDDSKWRSLDLPHDWAIEGPFDVEYNARCGGLPFHGTGWYRKTFEVPTKVKKRWFSLP